MEKRGTVRYKVCVYDECVIIYLANDTRDEQTYWLQKKQPGKIAWPHALIRALGEGVQKITQPVGEPMSDAPINFEFIFQQQPYFAIALRQVKHKPTRFTVQFMPEPSRDHKQSVDICLQHFLKGNLGTGWQECKGDLLERKDPALIQVMALALESFLV